MERKNRLSITFSEDEFDKNLEVTEWSNGAGVDFTIEYKGHRTTYPLSYKELHILRKLTRHILKNVD